MAASLLSTTPVVARILACSCGLDFSAHLTFLSIRFFLQSLHEVFRTKRNRREQLTLSPQACIDLQALVQPTSVPPALISQFLGSPTLGGGGHCGPRVASCHVVPLPPSPLSSAAVLLPLQPQMFMPGHPDVPPVLPPRRWDLWAFHVTFLGDGGGHGVQQPRTPFKGGSVTSRARSGRSSLIRY